jgi:hypothetical protein
MASPSDMKAFPPLLSPPQTGLHAGSAVGTSSDERWGYQGCALCRTAVTFWIDCSLRSSCESKKRKILNLCLKNLLLIPHRENSYCRLKRSAKLS